MIKAPAAMKAIAETRRTLATLLAEREALEARQAEDTARWQADREALARLQAELKQRQAEEEAQRQAERQELARWRAAEDARLQAERERRDAEDARLQAEEDARLPAEPAAKTARMKTGKIAQADPLATIKQALAAGTLAGPDAIDRAYQLGFAAGEQAARKAA